LGGRGGWQLQAEVAMTYVCFKAKYFFYCVDMDGNISMSPEVLFEENTRKMEKYIQVHQI
jgi:hypothetical protein